MQDLIEICHRIGEFPILGDGVLTVEQVVQLQAEISARRKHPTPESTQPAPDLLPVGSALAEVRRRQRSTRAVRGMERKREMKNLMSIGILFALVLWAASAHADGFRGMRVFERGGRIYAKAPGERTRLLTHDPNAVDFRPAASPDGKRVAFWRSRRGATSTPTLWVKYADGRERLLRARLFRVRRIPALLRLHWCATGRHIIVSDGRMAEAFDTHGARAGAPARIEQAVEPCGDPTRRVSRPAKGARWAPAAPCAPRTSPVADAYQDAKRVVNRLIGPRR